MKPTTIDVFFSCSFHENDTNVVDFFRALALGLDIRCRNVDRGSSAPPPDEARILIDDALFLIAVCTKRDRKESGVYGMPSAVREEIAMAKALNKPLLIFVEDGVELDGFIKSYSTHCVFNRDSLQEPSFIEKAISSLNNTKRRAMTSQKGAVEHQGPVEFHVEFVQSNIRLEKQDNSYVWHYAVRRKLHFSRLFSKELRVGAWATPGIIIPDGAPNLEWDACIQSGSQAFSFNTSVKGISSSHVQLGLMVDPFPDKDDWIEYLVTFRSPYLNPIFKKDILQVKPQIDVQGKHFYCCDGQVPIAKTDFIRVHFMFPVEYGLLPNDCTPIAGGITNKLNYLDEEEVERMRCKKELSGDMLLISCEIKRPYMNYAYGIAWNPPQ